MKFYKWINKDGHRGLIYKEGLNVDPHPFNPSGDCRPGGMYYSREDILAFIDYGEDLYEVEPVGLEVYENPYIPIKWKAHQVELKYVGKRTDGTVIQMLLDEGANIHVEDGFPLTWALRGRLLDVVRLLLKHGANYNEAMLWAVRNGGLDLLQHTIDLGADIHINKNLALIVAAQEGQLKIIKFLLEKGADIHANNDDAFHWAVFRRHVDVIKFLLEKGALVNCDALEQAAYGGQVPILKMLLDAGADIHIENDCALYSALKRTNIDIIEAMLEYDPNILETFNIKGRPSVRLLWTQLKRNLKETGSLWGVSE